MLMFVQTAVDLMKKDSPWWGNTETWPPATTPPPPPSPSGREAEDWVPNVRNFCVVLPESAESQL